MSENTPQRCRLLLPASLGATLLRLRLPALLAAALLFEPSAAPVRAQEGQQVAPGHIIPRIVSATDTSQAYSLYIPAQYVASRSWPLLVIMDPHGRAVEALRPFRDAAERRGWIVMSSYGTTGDGPMAPNVSAVNAMIADASATFTLDAHRIYLAGLSGTARIAWHFAAQLGGRVAGIYGAGAGGTVITSITDPPTGLAFFGAAGDSDFSYDEVRALKPWLEQHDIPHRLRFFHGDHRWPPEAVASEAVDWYELKAMQQGHESLLQAFVDSLFQKDTTVAATLEAAGRGADALDRYEEIAADYGPRASAARVAVTRLEADPAVEADLQRRLQESYAFEDFTGRLHGWVADLAQADEPTSPESGIHILGLEDLEAKLSAPDTTPEELASIRRRLSFAYVLLSAYQPEAFMDAAQPAKALVVLDVAATIRDDDPAALVLRAEAEAELGKKDEALDALERAVSLGATASSFANDPRLDKLRGEKRFRALGGGGPEGGGPDPGTGTR